MFKVLIISNKIQHIQFQKFHIRLMFQDNTLHLQIIQLQMEKFTQVKVTINQLTNQIDIKNIQAPQIITKIKEIHKNMVLILQEYLMDHQITKILIIIKILTVINNIIM